MSTLLDPCSLMSDLTPVLMLVDSSSSDYFIDSTYVNEHVLSSYPMSPIQLRLFNRTTNSTITQAIDLSLCFRTSDITPTTLHVTPLDGSYSLVLGHNWLTCHNLLIDWVSSSISFHSPEWPISVPLSSPPKPPNSLPPADPTPDVPPSFSQHKAPPITIISAPTFALACRLQGSVQFSLQIHIKESDLQSSSTTSKSSDLSGIPSDYHKFADVFSKSKANTLAPHHEHDLKIELKEGASPPLGTTYSLSYLSLSPFVPSSMSISLWDLFVPPCLLMLPQFSLSTRRMVPSVFALTSEG